MTRSQARPTPGPLLFLGALPEPAGVSYIGFGVVLVKENLGIYCAKWRFPCPRLIHKAVTNIFLSDDCTYNCRGQEYSWITVADSEVLPLPQLYPVVLSFFFFGWLCYACIAYHRNIVPVNLGNNHRKARARNSSIVTDITALRAALRRTPTAPVQARLRYLHRLGPKRLTVLPTVQLTQEITARRTQPLSQRRYPTVASCGLWIFWQRRCRSNFCFCSS